MEMSWPVQNHLTRLMALQVTVFSLSSIVSKVSIYTHSRAHERGISKQALVDDNTETPPVARECVALPWSRLRDEVRTSARRLTSNYFRCH